MTTNYRRALATAVHCDLVDESPRELIKQLDTLGLIAPDLPEPQLGCTSDDTAYINIYADWGRVNAMHGDPRILIDTHGTQTILKAEDAEHLALALLAAIKHQKENRHES